MNGFNTRRKRNIEYNHSSHPTQTSLNWGNEKVELEEDYEEVNEELELDNDEYEEGYEEVDVEIYDNEEESSKEMDAITIQNGKQLCIDGKPFIPKQMPKKQTFSDTHVRITTYLEKNTHQIIRMLQKQNQIESITKLINDSIKHYLTTKYNE